MSLRDFLTIEQRRMHIEKERDVSLSTLAIYPEELGKAAGHNCENMIGAVQIPVGVAGPLLLDGSWGKQSVYLPLATTEAALVASVNRGCKAISLSGGAVVLAQDGGITRGPVFTTTGLRQSLSVRQWITDSFSHLQQAAATTSSHIRLREVTVRVVGRNVFVRFSYQTGDAMGMNMVTSATTLLARMITQATGATCLAVAGNYDIDKKPAWLNAIVGRGKQVWAEATLPAVVLADVLKTTAEQVHEVAVKKCLLGSALSGSLGCNAQIANVIAALFLATGQDPAHVVEGSLGVTTTDKDNDALTIAVHLPALVIGTVGGGTALPAQQQALTLLGVAGGTDGSNALQFAEIIAGAVLAGELSLLASLAEGSLAKTHERLSGK